MDENHEWLFILANKGARLAGWWLKIRSQLELAEYLSETDSRYAKAFSNYVHDSFYDTTIGHGPYPKFAGLTLAAYIRGLNRGQSIVNSILGLQMETAAYMSAALERYGTIYINPNGGWCASQPESGDFCHRKTLVWPSFTESQIRISQFPGGRHYYAHIGDVQVRSGEKLKFDTYRDARQAAVNYITERT